MTREEIGARTAQLLLDAGAIAISSGRPYVLAAGWASPVYVDCRRLIGAPRLWQPMVALMAEYLATAQLSARFDLIAGAETAGIAFAAWLADRLGRDLRYVRKRRLGIGRNAQVEGGSVEGQRVLLLDDLATDGGSKLTFLRGLREAGAVVSDALVIFAHGAFPGAADRLAAQNVALHALATWRDVLALGVLEPAAQASVQDFVADPVGWSTAHGGRSAI